jgi:IclR family acetate operon transcriptional repressor
MNRMTSESTVDGTYSVRAVERALDVLDAVQEAIYGLTLAELAEIADLPKSSVFRYLSTLEGRGYVERDDDARFRVGRQMLAARSQKHERLVEIARPHLEALRDRFQETVNLGTLDGTRIAYLQVVESPATMRSAPRPGTREYIHSTALGKAIAANWLEDKQVIRILELEGMPKLTLRTIDDRSAFLAELGETRSRRFAIDDSENEDGGRCVAVPLQIDGAKAAISLSAPAFRLAPEQMEPVAAALMRAAQNIVRELEPGDA